MKVSVPHEFAPLQRMQVAHFLGRPGDLATREELVAFAKQSVTLRLAALPKPAASMDTVVLVNGVRLE